MRAPFRPRRHPADEQYLFDILQTPDPLGVIFGRWMLDGNKFDGSRPGDSQDGRNAPPCGAQNALRCLQLDDTLVASGRRLPDEWFNNLSNRGTRRVYKNTIRDFMRFTGIVRPEEFRVVTRAH